MSDSSKGYRFTFSGNTVTAVYEVEHGRMKWKDMDADESWSFDGTNVIKIEWDDDRQEITIYSDADRDGLFFKTGKTYAGVGSDVGRDDDHDRGSDDYRPWGSTKPDFEAALWSEKGYRFDIDAQGAITAVYEVKYGRVEAKHMNWNETWTLDGQDVIQTKNKFGEIETSVYTDIDQNGVFEKDFSLSVLTGENSGRLETYQFLLADGRNVTGDAVLQGDDIAGMMKLGRRGWKVDRIDVNETLQVVEIDGDNLILKTKTQWNGEIDFSVFRDDDNDGLWTKIADGETLDAYVSLRGEIDLVGIIDAGLLPPSDALNT